MGYHVLSFTLLSLSYFLQIQMSRTLSQNLITVFENAANEVLISNF